MSSDRIETMTPAEVFPLAQYLAEEMEARNWTCSDVAKRMQTPSGYSLDCFRIEILLAVQDEHLIIDDELIAGLARAFGVSNEFFRNLHQIWLDNPAARVAFRCPEGLFHD
ncbi:hypothetical protein Hden_1161 [Hyphomicrobium denitrificans ATCC 51888]|uniref:HTH cro/C1-type domain-containing protein n=1 Tax=Hyphomicrobium denitrificans (strain ATCC 51888 / DSM 1869 / NCIMB 11706 / TK 0415) TaxID=582899 RepID=D8JVT6_HYPDA|nr:transcriptional regulator [Hyphomicrobium denitrificans]ADJ22975.1 hypothetical protein Hden_1161 [Hyphomicrobium denitrificans ATCC 51888]